MNAGGFSAPVGADAFPSAGGGSGLTVLLDETIALANNGAGDSSAFIRPAGMTISVLHELTDAEEDDEIFLAFTNIRLQLYPKKTGNPDEWVISWRNDGDHGDRTMHLTVLGHQS
jgi:hypothetical protein